MTETRHLGDAQREHMRVIDGMIVAPWSWNTVELCEGKLWHPADDIVLNTQVGGTLLIADDDTVTSGRMLTTDDRYYHRVKRLYFLEFGIDLGVSLTKGYVPWWAGKFGNDKVGNKIKEDA